MKKSGFTIVELLLVLAITGLLVVCMAPALTKKPTPPDVTQKITCTPGQRYVIQNLYAVEDGQDHAYAREGKIVLPPGVNSFVVTLSGGGGGGGYALVAQNWNQNPTRADLSPDYDVESAQYNLGGGGGGGAAFMYKTNISFKLVDFAIPVRVHYSLGGGGRGGESDVKNDYQNILDGQGDVFIAGKDRNRRVTKGASSHIDICGMFPNTVMANGQPVTCAPDSPGGCCRIKVSGGEVDESRYSDAPAFNPSNVDKRALKSYWVLGKDFFEHEIVLRINETHSSPGGDNGGLTYISAGQNGEKAMELLPGLGGASVFGTGSFGAGGSGGMEAMEKRFNIKRGTAGWRRSGEDGNGGILILEFDSVCTNRKEF